MKSYKELIVWQKSYVLTLKVYGMTKGFPKYEVYGLVSQMRRAAVSIPSNIAEGYSRSSRKDYANFIQNAYASGAELETQLLLSADLGYTERSNYELMRKDLDEVMRMLFGLLKRLRI